MSNTVTFEVEERNESLNPRQIRAEGKIPATIYGKGAESVSIQVDRRNFVNLYKNNKDSVYELKANKKSYKVVVQNFQIEASTQKEMNIEFKLV